MIVVKVELWPFGQEELAKTLGVATITNDRTGTQDSGNYVTQLFKETRYARPWKKVRVREFARKTLSSWDLLYRVLDKVVSRESRSQEVRKRMLHMKHCTERGSEA